MLTYRKDIDGLRALAVMLVILFHFQFQGFAGGFIGVDIFFVISGYLIGSIIVSDLNKSRFSFTQFYERRIRRILPALYLVIATSLLFTFLFFDSLFLIDLTKTVLATVLFSSNILFYQTTNDYFTPEGGGNVLLHTWSLSVEEQFYFFFPLVIFLAYRYSRKYVLHFMLGLTILSFGLNALIAGSHPVFSFYLPFTRIWEFTAGFLITALPALKNKRSVVSALSFAGILLMIAGVIVIDRHSDFPGYAALLPVSATALLLYTGSQRSPARIIFSQQPFVFIGRISYSLYLWHWPVKFFSDYFLDSHKRPITVLIPLLFTFLAAIVSWRFIEQPFREKKGLISRKKVFAFAFIAGGALIGLSIFSQLKKGFPGRLADNALLTELSADDIWTQTWKYNKNTYAIDAFHPLPAIGKKEQEPDFLIWGDSHAGMMLPVFEKVSAEKGKSGFVAITVGVPPFLPDTDFKKQQPDKYKVSLSIFEFVKAHRSIKKVFLIAKWPFHSSATDPALKTNPAAFFATAITRLIDSLNSINKEVVIMGPTPELTEMPRQYYYKAKFGHREINDLTPGEDVFFEKNKPVFTFFTKLEQVQKIRLLTPQPYFFKNGKTLLVYGNHFLFIDTHHLSYWGALQLKELITKEYDYHN